MCFVGLLNKPISVISASFTPHSSHVRGHELCDDVLEGALELRLHSVTHQHQQHLQSPEGHRLSLVSRIATGELHHHDLVSDGLMANYQIAKPACGSLIGLGIDSGMLDEINHREHEISRAARRAAHIQVGHALDQVGHVYLCCLSLPGQVCFDLRRDDHMSTMSKKHPCL